MKMANGYWLLGKMNRLPVRLVCILLLCASEVGAKPALHRFAVPPVSLDRALSILARQGDVDIGGAFGGLESIPSAGVVGDLSASAALRLLLSGTGFAAVKVGPSSFRIVRVAVPTQRQRTIPDPPRSVGSTDGISVREASESPILVTASKRGDSRFRYTGSVVTAAVEADPREISTSPSTGGLGELTRMLPILQTTDLGSGRNKLFIRGIADSSFTGPTQNTATIYLGDVPLGYSGSDSDLNLYDIRKIEILEGPQGTLYGAGAIGGVIRLSPNPPDLSRRSLKLSAGATTTAHGGLGSDLASVVNLPLVDDRLGIRAVSYSSVAGGYINDLRRGLRRINQTKTRGGRLNVAAIPGNGWGIDAGVVYQTIEAADSQYALRGNARLSRASSLAQPFEDHFLLLHLVVKKSFESGVKLTWSSGWSSHRRDELFDATGRRSSQRPRAYQAINNSKLLFEEARLSRSLPSGTNWVLGVSLIRDQNDIRRRIGPANALVEIIGISDRSINAALFGEASVAISPRLLVSSGARLTRARSDSSPTVQPRNRDYITGRTSVRLDPSIGINWLVAPRMAVFARYQSGFRTGGLSVAPGIGRVEDFRPDTVRIAEAGLRIDGPRFVGSAAFSYSRWDNIQADLIDRRGFPYTTNIGNGHLVGFEIAGNWVLSQGLRLSAAAFINESRLTSSNLRLPPDELPDTPRFSAAGGFAYRRPLGRGDLIFSADARYVGRSYIGARPLLAIRQGGYVDDNVKLEWRGSHLGISMSVRNLTDRLGDRFAIGNPFELGETHQYTPLRPRNLRIGVDVGW